MYETLKGITKPTQLSHKKEGKWIWPDEFINVTKFANLNQWRLISLIMKNRSLLETSLKMSQ